MQKVFGDARWGALFLVFNRNLWPLIIFHGLIDTVGFTALYLDLE